MRQDRQASGFRGLWSWLFTEIIGNAVLALVLATILVVSVSWAAGFYTDIWLPNVLAEAHGMVLDILVIGVGITLLNRLSEKKQDIKRYKEEIDDFRFWDSDEAAHRIAGNVRRLSTLGATSNINLRSCCLREANLQATKLDKANLRGVNLQEADLRGANLTGADLYRANLQGTELQGADLRGADLRGADLRGADLYRANLQEANLEGAKIARANFSRANLRQTNTIERNFCDVRSLAGAELDTEVQQLIQQVCPEVLEEEPDP